MSPNTLERAVLLSHLDDRLKTILKMKLREFVHLNPCFNAVTALNEENYSIDLRNQNRLVALESSSSRPRRMKKAPSCPHRHRIKSRRRKMERRVAI